MKGKTKEQKGITLVALIVTIVVLLILATVTINSIQNYGIINKAKNVAEKFNEAQEKEQNMFNEYLDYFNGNSGSNKAYSIGDEVTVKGEEFYVIVNSDKNQTTVLLLAKENINTTTLVQSSSANTIEFSETDYWTSYPSDLTETGVPDSTHYAAYAAYQYGAKIGGTGRLMTYDEANALIGAGETAMIWGEESTNGYLCYWLGTAYDSDAVYGAWSSSKTLDWSYYDDGQSNGVRPVIEISKDLITKTETETDTNTDTETKIISFTIAGTTYYAEDGMTWYEWLESEMNTDGCTEDSEGFVRSGGDKIIICSNCEMLQLCEYVGNERYAGVCSNCDKNVFEEASSIESGWY